MMPLLDKELASGDLCSVLKRQNEITTLSVQMQTSQLLPHWDIPTYDGNPLQFNSFMETLEHCGKAKTNRKGHGPHSQTARTHKSVLKLCM